MSLIKSNPLKTDNKVNIILESDGKSISLKLGSNPIVIAAIMSVEQLDQLQHELEKILHNVHNYNQNKDS